jgi:hippurate hydrolase
MKLFVKTLLTSVALGAAALPPVHAELDVAGLKAAIEQSVEADYPRLDALYKDIHEHPEIAFQEVKTAAKLAEQMRALGFEVTEKVGKTGLVAIYKNGDGPTIMVRTELDGLPMQEKTGLAYASHDKTVWNGRETFVAHSCGHDIHMASWVGTARTFGRPQGQVEGHADVHRPARRRDGIGRQGDAGGRRVHALPETRFRIRAA